MVTTDRKLNLKLKSRRKNGHFKKCLKFEHKKEFPEVSKKKGYTNSERYRNSESTLIQKGSFFFQKFSSNSKIEKKKELDFKKLILNLKKSSIFDWSISIDHVIGSI